MVAPSVLLNHNPATCETNIEPTRSTKQIQRDLLGLGHRIHFRSPASSSKTASSQSCGVSTEASREQSRHQTHSQPCVHIRSLDRLYSANSKRFGLVHLRRKDVRRREKSNREAKRVDTHFGQVAGTTNWESSKSVHWVRMGCGRSSSSTKNRVIAIEMVSTRLSHSVIAYVVFFCLVHSQPCTSDIELAKPFPLVLHRYTPGDILCTLHVRSHQPWSCPPVRNFQCKLHSPQRSLTLSGLSFQVSMRECSRALPRFSPPITRQAVEGFLPCLHYSSRERQASLKASVCRHVVAPN